MIKKFYEYYSDEGYEKFLNSIKKYEIDLRNINEYDDEVNNIDNEVKWLELNKKEKEVIKDFSYLEDDYYYYELIHRPFSISLTKTEDDYYYIFLVKINQSKNDEDRITNKYYKLDQLSELKYFLNCLKNYITKL